MCFIFSHLIRAPFKLNPSYLSKVGKIQRDGADARWQTAAFACCAYQAPA